jgi:ubiquinone/menaquinone biosynthesis C-methylase UbiE
MATIAERILDSQYRRPSGWLGEWIGMQMARDHRPENLWTVQVLNAQPDDQILEIGFGAGVAIQELARIVRQGSISGVDFSRTMLAAARRRNAAAVRAGKVKLYDGVADDLPFESETFDKVFSIHSVYFWPDALAALREIRRVLKPGGILVLTILPKGLWNVDQPDMPVGTPECKPYSANELEVLLMKAGFRSTRVEADPNLSHRSNTSVCGEC